MPVLQNPGDEPPFEEEGHEGRVPEEDSPAGSTDYAALKRVERIVPHYPARVLPHTHGARQFEFHPTLPDTVLVGDKRGNVLILEGEGEEGVHPPLNVGNFPVLALVWLRHHPQIAISGSASSGHISFVRYTPNAGRSEPCLRQLHCSKDFANLTSLSANCTDDYLLATGLSRNVEVYDVRTGQTAMSASGIHDHFINIGRFCNETPHIFATASFDHTCRIWDLRQPLVKDRCIRVLTTDERNVMCVFSHDDRQLLCSGVDTRVSQFEVPSWRRTPEKFELREPHFQGRYRRSMYMAGSPYIVTGATEESHLKILSMVTGEGLGVIELRGQIMSAKTPATATPSPMTGVLKRFPAASLRNPWRWSRMDSRQAHCADIVDMKWQQDVIRGQVEINDSLTSTQSGHEFVQSVRAHPIVKNRIGVMVCYGEPKESCVATLHVEPSCLGWEA